MRARVGLGALVPALILSASPAEAQLVRADIHVAGGPVAGRVVIGNHRVHRVIYRDARPVVVVERRAPVVVVRSVHVPRGRAYGYWKSRGYRRVVLYQARGRFYDRYYRGVPGLREIVVYERGGRYYLPDHDGRYDRRDDRRDRDRYQRRDSYDSDRDDWYDDDWDDDRDRDRPRGDRGRNR